MLTSKGFLKYTAQFTVGYRGVRVEMPTGDKIVKGGVWLNF